MATKGSAGKSASGASMSRYDVEVESRLQALEKAVASLKSEPVQAHSHEASASTDGVSKEEFNTLIQVLKRTAYLGLDKVYK